MAAVSNEIKTPADGMGIQRTVLELVNLRVFPDQRLRVLSSPRSHLALRGRESPERIAVLPAWRASGLFTSVEQAALTIAEAVTAVSA